MNTEIRTQKRAAILEAALSEFREMGFERAKIEEIARSAGIGKSTVYEYFESKEILLVEVLQEGMERLNTALSDLLSSPNTLRETLATLFGHAGRALCESMLPFSVDIKSCPAAVSFLREHGDRELQVVLDLLETRVRRAIQEGEVRGDLDAHFAAGMAFSLIMATGNHIRRVPAADDSYAHRAVDLLFEGIAPGK